MVNRTDDWGQYLDAAVFATNTSIQSSTKYTPFQLMFGRSPRFPLEAEKEGENVSFQDMHSLVESNAEDVLEKVLAKQKQIFVAVDENIKKAQEKQIEQYRKRKGVVSHHFKKGDQVLRRNMKQKTRKGSKREDRWLGPYEILEMSKTTCVLQNKAGKCLKTRVNTNQLKPYLQATLSFNTKPIEKPLCGELQRVSAAESLLKFAQTMRPNTTTASDEGRENQVHMYI